MAKGGCGACGQQTPNARLCKECQRLERQGFFNGDSDGSTPSTVDLVCVECSAAYRGNASTACPECGETRCRSPPRGEA